MKLLLKQLYNSPIRDKNNIAKNKRKGKNPDIVHTQTHTFIIRLSWKYFEFSQRAGKVVGTLRDE